MYEPSIHFPSCCSEVAVISSDFRCTCRKIKGTMPHLSSSGVIFQVTSPEIGPDGLPVHVHARDSGFYMLKKDSER